MKNIRAAALQKTLLAILTYLVLASASYGLPSGFVYLQDVDASIIQDMRYVTRNNFIGRPVPGYLAPRCILTQEGAFALAAIQRKLKAQSLGIKVYDCYRPQTAVNGFVAWSKDPSDQLMKQAYYPRVNKADLFKLGYIMQKSGHTRGSTVDMTLVHLGEQPTDMEMGTHFDLLDPLSHTLSPDVSAKARHNRLFLRAVMEQGGFVPIAVEWWHFTLRDEPFPETYFDFAVR